MKKVGQPSIFPPSRPVEILAVHVKPCFIVAYGPTDTVSNTREQKDIFWVDLGNAVSRVPSSDYLFVLIDANARTGVCMGEEDCKVIGAYQGHPGERQQRNLASAVCG